MDDFVYAVVDTEGHHSTLHDVCIIVVSIKAATAGVPHSMVHFPTITMNTIGRYVGAIADTFERCEYIVAHNMQTDMNNIEYAFTRSGYSRDIPPKAKWRDSVAFARKLRSHPDSTIFANMLSSANDLGTLYKHVFQKPISGRHSAVGDTVALVDILERVRAREPSLFSMCFSRSGVSVAARVRTVGEAHVAENNPDDICPALPAHSRTTSRFHHLLEGEDETPPVVVVATLHETFARVPTGDRIAGPLRINCNVSTHPVQGFYVWAWDTTNEAKRGVPHTQQIVDIPATAHIRIVDKKAVYKMFVDKNGTCFGVYNREERVLRIL